MALFRTVSDADVREMLAAFGVAGYRAHQPIAVGTINTNLRVETDAEPLFLRINEGKSEDDVWREAAIVAHAAAQGVPTPVPRAPSSRPRTPRRSEARWRSCTSRAPASPITRRAATSRPRSTRGSRGSRRW